MGALATIPDQVDAALILRHAEREEIAPGTFGIDVPLTAHGVASAEQLGKTLIGKRRVSVTSSPVSRCVQTAEAILRGGCCDIGPDRGIVLERRLGDPGPFVVDPDVAGSLFLTVGILDIVRRQLSNAEPPAGMRPTDDGVRMLMDLVANGLGSRGWLNMYVTHDSILAVLVARLFGILIDEVGWPGYLDGLLMWRSCERLHATWRGSHKATDPPGG